MGRILCQNDHVVFAIRLDRFDLSIRSAHVSYPTLNDRLLNKTKILGAIKCARVEPIPICQLTNVVWNINNTQVYVDI